MTRQELETAALHNVCACWHFDLTDNMAETDDETLAAIIVDSQHCHRVAHIEQPGFPTIEAELAECPDSKPA